MVAHHKVPMYPSYLNVCTFTDRLTLMSRSHCSVSSAIFALKNRSFCLEPIVCGQLILIHCYVDQRALKVKDCISVANVLIDLHCSASLSVVTFFKTKATLRKCNIFVDSVFLFTNHSNPNITGKG